MNKLIWTSALLGFGLVAACGGNDPAASNEETGGTSNDVSGSGGTGSSTPVIEEDPLPPKYEACAEYRTAVLRRRAECLGFPREDQGPLEDGLFASCPDVYFSEGSTRTVDSLLACAKVYETFPCEDVLANRLPSCVTPGTHELGESCISSSQCASLACTAEYADSCGECVPMLETGAACVANYQCPSTDTCTGTCTAAPITAPGIPMKLGAECSSSCVAGAACVLAVGSSTPTCIAMAKLGEDCEVTPGAPPCSPGLTCSMDTAKCVANLGDGELCFSGDAVMPCALGLLCLTTNYCAPAPRENETCADAYDGTCGSGLACVEGVCKKMPERGEACSETGAPCAGILKCQAGACEYPMEPMFYATCP